MSRADVIRMANQIARQFDHLPAAQARTAVAAHFNTFWAPAMRADLLRAVTEEPAALHPGVLAAADAVREHLSPERVAGTAK